MKINFPDELKQSIREHGEEGYPHEICGAMIGTFHEDRIDIREVIRLENLREENRERRYEVTPQDQLKAERRAEERDMDVVGYYHSHPDHPARPSQYDLDHAWPKYLYVIVSVQDGASEDLNTWQMTGDGEEFNQLEE